MSSNSVYIQVNPDGQRKDVSGASCQPAMDSNITDPQLPIGELLGGIDGSFVVPLVGFGSPQTWFAVGSSYSGSATAVGHLYLVFNDGYYDDNIGSYDVTITVTRHG